MPKTAGCLVSICLSVCDFIIFTDSLFTRLVPKEGNQHLVPGTSVICALGQRSRTDVVNELRNAAPYVSVIGDAAKVSTIKNAVYWGYHAVLDI